MPDLDSGSRRFESSHSDVQDKLLGRKSNWNWGKNSKRELKFIEKRELMAEIDEELAQEAEEKSSEEERITYEKYLENHWVNQLISQRG